MSPRPRQAAAVITPDVEEAIIALLANPKFSPGAKAGHLLRRFPKVLALSVSARLAYVLIANLMTKAPSAKVTRATLAGWLGHTERQASRVIRELTRSGPLPLLTVVTGRQGRVSTFGWVSNPFMLAVKQAEGDKAVRARRQPLVLKRQAAVMSDDTLTPDEQLAKGRKVALIRDWTTATRPARSQADVLADIRKMSSRTRLPTASGQRR